MATVARRVRRQLAAERHPAVEFEQAWAVGTGRRQAGGQAGPPIADPYVETRLHWSGGGTMLDLAGESMNLRAAANAVMGLAEVVERVRNHHLKRAEQEANAALRRRHGRST